MRSHVFTDARLARLAGRFVWLEVNGEDERNAAFLERFPIDAWPTLLVIDPTTGDAVVRWTGSTGVKQLERMLLDAERSTRQATTPAGEALARADRLNAKGDAEAAERAYREALEKGGPGWARRPRAVESLVTLLATQGTPQRCVDAVLAAGPGLPRGPSFVNVVVNGLGCATSLPADAEGRGSKLSALEALGREGLDVPGLLADDRAGLFDALTSAASERGDEAGARALAERWWKFLEAEGRRAPTPEARAALDTWRLSAAVALGDPGRALAPLLRSEKELPDHLDSPYRVASVYRLMGKLDEALAANDRALALTKGPRRLRVYLQRAAIGDAKGDATLSRKALQDAIAFEAKLPASQRQPQLATQIETKLAKLGP